MCKCVKSDNPEVGEKQTSLQNCDLKKATRRKALCCDDDGRRGFFDRESRVWMGEDHCECIIYAHI